MVKTLNKTGSNFLVMNDNQHGYSSDEDNAERPYTDYDFTTIQEVNEENEESEEEDSKMLTMSLVMNHLQMKTRMMNMKVLLFCTMT